MDQQEFYKLRGELEIETFDNLSRAIDQGKMPLHEYPLGCFLEVLRYEDEKVKDIYRFIDSDKLDGIRIYGIDEESKCSFFQNASERDIFSLVSKWSALRGPELGWNPKYANITNVREIENFCQEHDIKKFLSEFNISGTVRSSVYPFDGWSMTRYLEIASH